jgi:cyclopropane fatty-acyl-phospholipid synthase-like methyltransferase
MSVNNFDRIAFAYDSLSKLVFGGAIKKSQLHYLAILKPKSSVLILGGGTGWLLKELTAQYPNANICYIEASGKMLNLSKALIKNHEHIRFIHGTESNIPQGSKFDVVITNFYLDLFTTKSLQHVIDKINTVTTADTVWLVSDFITPETWWQKILMKLMYRFFKITTHIEASSLPEWSKLLSKNGWTKKSYAMFYHHFIKSCYFVKNKKINYRGHTIHLIHRK